MDQRMRRNAAHLVFRGSDRFREDYEVQSRATGKRLGSVNQVERRLWVAKRDVAYHGIHSGTADTMRLAALILWPDAGRAR